jgi:propionaldehyde dehydrogenase
MASLALGGEGARRGIFEDMSEAVAAAKKAQAVMRRLTMDQRELIIAKIRAKTIENAELFARMAVEETGMGNVGHKILKHRLVAEKTPGTEDIVTTAWSGDRGLTLTEMGPFGVIGAITPSTNPSETIICNAIGMIAGGNTVVFCPHPGAAKTSLAAVSMINEACAEAGGPENAATVAANPTVAASAAMMKHPDIQLITATGGPGVVTAALSSGKRAIGAGAGNPPALADETADIAKAAADIVNGCSFDNNLPCIAEKAIVALDTVADELIGRMVADEGCYLIKGDELAALTRTIITEKGLNRACVGRSARALLAMIGVNAPDSTRCVVFEGAWDHPLIKEETMTPVIGAVRARDFADAVDTAVRLESGNRHSAHIHSKNVDRITAYAKATDTAILVKNAPSYAAIGFGGEGFCTFTIASRTGEGLTSAATFTKRRRCVMADSLCIR